MIVEAIGLLVQRKDLSSLQVEGVMKEIAEGQATPAQMGAFLAAMGSKGETAEELLGAVLSVRRQLVPVSVRKTGLLDTCGTGGDGAATFNISTAAALVAAAAGATVAKHGSRSVSSRSGSADVLAALGVEVGLPPERVSDCIERVGIGFLFAGNFNPVFAAVAQVRKELGVRSFFNLLGPLANPAGAQHQLLGVFAPRWVPIVGQVLAALPTRHALVVHGGGLDEVSVCSETSVCEVQNGTCREFVVSPEELGLVRRLPEELVGKDPAFNARVIRDILDGVSGGPRDAVLANAGAALYAADRVHSLVEGVRVAAAAVDSGAGRKTLDALVRASQEAVS